MKLTELYASTPAEKHGNIKVTGERVIVRSSDGSYDEYLVGSDGELWLCRSNREERQDMALIKEKLGIPVPEAK